jgi:hypothetical protein
LSAVHSMLEQTDKEMQAVMLVSIYMVKWQKSKPFCLFNSVVYCVAASRNSSPSSVPQGIIDSYSTLSLVAWEAVTVVEGVP